MGAALDLPVPAAVLVGAGLAPPTAAGDRRWRLC
ncbi:hypothetical protein J3R04_002886 [Spirilliplanes yamanashiensis]|nr:hypothetical protein [Spirilliplanes yamanashiensis]